MTMHLELGLCYRMVFSDGGSMQFRYLGLDRRGQPMVETPPGSGRREVITRSDVQDLYEIDVPREELEAYGI
jgi:hypothetical protein